MLIHDLVDKYMTERNYTPETVNDLLDYYQFLYVSGQIDIKRYHRIFACLHKQGATSAFEYEPKRPITNACYTYSPI
ncbi:YppF family protein [Oceanobacillus halophilus]|uniref:Uncharacterized protein n=1 Tax=Oceanobacillus halophilus TaxID=930130 RepID=A0A495A148_9BACI|nr:YppF family protein [Oceanobacillus halophilus]RKQ32604.1 hypothetical protein D8M06_11740 [Oceanobacillus halophilus]